MKKFFFTLAVVFGTASSSSAFADDSKFLIVNDVPIQEQLKLKNFCIKNVKLTPEQLWAVNSVYQAEYESKFSDSKLSIMKAFRLNKDFNVPMKCMKIAEVECESGLEAKITYYFVVIKTDIYGDVVVTNDIRDPVNNWREIPYEGSIGRLLSLPER